LLAHSKTAVTLAKEVYIINRLKTAIFLVFAESSKCQNAKFISVWSSKDENMKKLSAEHCPNRTIVSYPYDTQCSLLKKVAMPAHGNVGTKINRA
jgi:hypothetical protein